ncbi:MAG: basic amino acid ABC transporter substrate-binding protein [Deltaproteobacteria bacterium]|nr:basic amino acid ABC transporter substrate-binding protein [Deltaproteobacteria bacterium]
MTLFLVALAFCLAPLTALAVSLETAIEQGEAKVQPEYDKNVAEVAEKIVDKTITFASDATWPPMEFVDESKNIVGFSVDLVNAMAKAGGFTPVIKNTAWDGIFAGLIAGKYDAVSSSVTITEERQKAMDFSEPYFEVKQGVVVKDGSAIKTQDDLKGKKVGAQIGTTGFFTSKRLVGDSNSKSYDEVGLAIADLANGRLDAVICDDAVAADYALTNPEYKESLNLAFLVESDTPEYLGFAVQKGDAATLAVINASLAKIKASGEYDEIFKKWFGSN